jgi:hypothetical protein
LGTFVLKIFAGRFIWGVNIRQLWYKQMYGKATGQPEFRRTQCRAVKHLITQLSEMMKIQFLKDYAVMLLRRYQADVLLPSAIIQEFSLHYFNKYSPSRFNLCQNENTQNPIPLLLHRN